MASEETSADKQQALLKLQVSDAEWERVAEVLRILKVRLLAFSFIERLLMRFIQHAESAQHSFSSETEPTLSAALPALEKLHNSWTSMSTKPKYERYHEALNAGISKIATYYNKTSSVDAYNLTMGASYFPLVSSSGVYSIPCSSRSLH